MDALILEDVARAGRSEHPAASERPTVSERPTGSGRPDLPGPRDPRDPSDPRGIRAPDPVTVRWLGRVDYRWAWDAQRALAAARADGRIGDQLLLLEHPPVLTLGRHADERHVLAPPALLDERGIEVVRVERGGEVTYHGPGQLVAYPILELTKRGLLLRPLVRALEGAMVDACAAFGVAAGRRDGHPGCWCDPEGATPRKIGALGIRVERGVSYHGIALNVSTDLRDFLLIDPCGTPGLVSTSIEAELAALSASVSAPDGPPTGDAPPPGNVTAVPPVQAVAAAFARALAVRLGTTLAGALPPDADPRAERAALERLSES